MIKGPLPLKIIITQRTLIRPVLVQDTVIMHDAMAGSFDLLRKWMPWAQHLATKRDTEIYLAHGERLWANSCHEGVELPLQIMDIKNEIYYGATGIKPANLMIPSFEIGYWINKQVMGQGLVTEAMNALTRYLFDALGAKRVEINCEKENQKSANVALRLNYDLEGELRNHRLTANNKHVANTLIYSCIDPSVLPPLEYQWQ